MFLFQDPNTSVSYYSKRYHKVTKQRYAGSGLTGVPTLLVHDLTALKAVSDDNVSYSVCRNHIYSTEM